VASKDRLDPTHLRPAPCPWRRRRIAPRRSNQCYPPHHVPPSNRISSRCCRVRAPSSPCDRRRIHPTMAGAVKGRPGRPAAQSRVGPRYIRRTTKCTPLLVELAPMRRVVVKPSTMTPTMLLLLLLLDVNLRDSSSPAHPASPSSLVLIPSLSSPAIVPLSEHPRGSICAMQDSGGARSTRDGDDGDGDDDLQRRGRFLSLRGRNRDPRRTAPTTILCSEVRRPSLVFRCQVELHRRAFSRDRSFVRSTQGDLAARVNIATHGVANSDSARVIGRQGLR
jgi:hypothetical protein